MNFTQREFNALNLHQKATVLSNATFLTRLSAGGIIYSLYTFKDYYIEVGIDSATKYIIEIAGMDKGERLEKYLSHISIDLAS